MNQMKDRIGEPESDCYKFLQRVINDLRNDNLKTPADLINHVNKAKKEYFGGAWYLGTDFGPSGNTFIESAASFGMGTVDTLHFGDRYFLDNPFDPLIS